MEEIVRLRSAFTGDFTVTERPEPIPGDLRIGWGQSLLLLVLASSRGMRCSLQKVHFLVHLSRTARSREETREVLARKRSPAALSVRIEPWVNRAAAFSKGNGLVETKDGKSLSLTEAGKAAVKAIRSAGVLSEEAAFLDEVGRFTTEQVVDSIMKMEAF
ncbi:hypothetical protein [Magnetospirillum sulfuroxidans]|uniref:HTH marR-type domain-containing protein n=1 Tax=Magnetospirillum sulfuroxidans TaxID=611300 RepID=A0ABS5IHK5_9PROT|nr:hypothetical protein [Magnetospirillum sulfuroxidans]MBR9973877.1 hypothetical protein [Magnetospirillum sulfuroxidans]